jgi:peptide/nickel transport system substrate-binding protein
MKKVSPVMLALLAVFALLIVSCGGTDEPATEEPVVQEPDTPVPDAPEQDTPVPDTPEPEEPAQEDLILLYGGNQDIDNIDPATGENYSINAALRSLYDALYLARGSEISPHLVETAEANDDASIWTFDLVQTATFNDDGSPVNAEAVVYSFNRAMELQGAPTYRWEGIVESVEAIDEFTVQFTLAEPFAPFPGTLTQMFIVNPATVEANRGDDFGQTYLKDTAAGSGPFVQGRWEIGNLYEFTAVDNYWAGRPGPNAIDGFLWIIQREGSTQVNSLLSGEAHVADTIDASDIDKISDTDGFSIEQHPGFFLNTLKFNTQQGPMSDVNVRRAVAHAMDYDSLPDVLDNQIWLLPGPQPDNFPGFVEDLPIPTFDLDKARDFLAASDYADEWEAGTLELDYVYVTDFAMEEVPGLILLASLAEIGVTLNMTPMLWPDMVASCGSVETGPDIINIYTLPSYADPDAHYYNQYHSSSWGTFNSCNFYSNPRVDELLDMARSEADADARLDMYGEVQEILVEDAPAAWMYNEAGLIARNDCVGGYLFSPMYPITVLFQDLTMNECP